MHIGILADMSTLQVWDPLTVKLQTIKTAIEVRPFPHLFSTCTRLIISLLSVHTGHSNACEDR